MNRNYCDVETHTVVLFHFPGGYLSHGWCALLDIFGFVEVIEGKAPSKGVFWLFHRGECIKRGQGWPCFKELLSTPVHWSLFDETIIVTGIKKKSDKMLIALSAHISSLAVRVHTLLWTGRDRIEHCFTQKIFGLLGRSSHLRFNIFSKSWETFTNDELEPVVAKVGKSNARTYCIYYCIGMLCEMDFKSNIWTKDKHSTFVFLRLSRQICFTIAPEEQSKRRVDTHMLSSGHYKG